MKINILLCDTFPGLLPPSIPSYAWMFTSLFDSIEAGSHDYRIWRAMDGELPDISTTEGLHVVTGCNLSAYDNVDWVVQLLEWLRQANAAQLKVVGICFGHQAVAQALGGKVERSDKGWGIGIRRAEIVEQKALSHMPGGSMLLLYNHHDQVTQLPQGATLVARSAFCPIESFAIGNHILTFQGHPEYLAEYDEHLIRHFADDEPQDVKLAALESMRTHKHQGADVARWIVAWAKE